MISIALVLALLQANAVATVDPNARAATARGGGDPLLLEEVQRIATRVETLRGEKFVRPPFAVRVPDDMREVAAGIRAFNLLSRDRLAARGRAWEDIGLGETGAPLDLLRVLAADLDGIGFDPTGNRLLVTPACLRPEDFEPTEGADDGATVLMLTGMRPDAPRVAHLLMHVRQRERTGQDVLRATTDELLASAAWAEGEANLVALSYLFSGMAVEVDVLGFVKSPGEVLNGILLPPSIERLAVVQRALVDFVYLDGFQRAIERQRAGGWDALLAAMERRRTTRDLLHPELPARRAADFPAEPTPPRAGLRAIDVDSIGEQAIVVLVSTLTAKDSLGLLAGEGWAGDRLVRWESADASGAASGITEWVTRWGPIDGDPVRSAAEVASDFDYAYGRALEARFAGRTFSAVGPHSRTLLTADRLYRIELRAPEGAAEAEVRVRVQPLAQTAPQGAERPEPSR